MSLCDLAFKIDNEKRERERAKEADDDDAKLSRRERGLSMAFVRAALRKKRD